MWPFRRKEAVPPPELKAASFLVPLGGGGSSLASTSAGYNTLAAEGYAINCIAYSCINRIATSVASVEPQLYRKGKAGKLEKVESSPLLDLLENPNPAQSGKEFMEYLVSYFLTAGNAYLYGNGMEKQVKAPPAELQLLNPGKVRIEPGRGYFPQFYEYKPTAGSRFEYPVDQVSGASAVMHLKTFNPLNPWYGLPPMLAAAYGIDIFNSGQKWNKKLLDNDARPSGALKVTNAEGKPDVLSEEQYQRLKEMIDRMFSGADNAGRPLLLEGGLEWEALSESVKDIDFLNGKHSSARDIALAFGVPPMLLGIPGDNTYSNMQEAKVGFWTDTVIPRLCWILEALNRWLTPRFGEDLYLWYDEEMIPALEPLRKAKADRINAANYLTIDEKRAAMGYDAYKPGEGPGGILLVPQSDIPLELAGAVDLPEPGSPADQEEQPEAEEDEEAEE